MTRCVLLDQWFDAEFNGFVDWQDSERAETRVFVPHTPQQ